MSLQETAPQDRDDDAGPPTQADLRMAGLLSDDTRSGCERDALREENSPVADDLLGRLNALDFIDSVLGDDFDLPGRIGDFEITGVLGRGGMGTVYKAYQETLDREVALKVLAPRFSSDVTMRKRFRTEAKATAAMHHRHIVPIYGYGEASGHLFFAMELVVGVSLDKHITVARRRGDTAMEPLEAARRFAGVADALALAHNRQILHRDVKPGNLLVHDDGTLALADFGLSKFLGEVSVHLTSVGGFLGTLHYSPPEQARGETVGPAGDLYSLGVTLFEAMTGKLPVYGQSTESMLHALLHDEPIRLRELVPKAPLDLEAVVDKLLQKDPRDRYQDGEALALDLLRVAEGEPVRIRRQRLATRMYRWVRRNPVLASISAASLVLLIVTGLWLQSILVNRSISREKAGREHLADAAIAVAREPGPPTGPFGLLDALSGVDSDVPEKSSVFLREIASAAELLPEESANLVRYRDAYLGQALRRDTGSGVRPIDLIEQGNGFAAVAAITTRIREIESRYRTDDLGVRIDLYNLYLARALANLTASVADPRRAANDLSLAAFIRSGAMLPRILQRFLAWEDPAQPQKLLESLKTYLDSDDARLERATAQFLLAFAGICPPAGSHLMRFPMDYAVRRVLSQKAIDVLGIDAAQRAEWYYGLEHRLAGYAAAILGNLGNALNMAAPMAAGRKLLASSVAPGSPLRAWQYTFDLLNDDPNGSGLTEEQRLRGSIHFVRVVQRTLPVDEAELILRNVSRFLTDLVALKDSPRAELATLAVELRARLASWVEAPAEADAAAAAWLRINDQDPEAQACKFCSLVRAAPKSDREFFAALVHGLNALEYAVGRAQIRSRLRTRVSHELDGVADTAVKGILRRFLDKLDRSRG